MNVDLTLQDYLFLSPFLILLFGALAVLLIACFNENKTNKISFVVTLLTFTAAFYATSLTVQSNNSLLLPWLKVDTLSYFFTKLFLVIGFISTFLGFSFFEKFKFEGSEYYFLLIASIFGLILIGSSNDFLTLFIGLETLSISLYVLCGYVKKWKISHESAIKYFLIGSLGTAFFLYGIALIYGAAGTTNFNELSLSYLSIVNGSDKTLFFSGMAFVTVGLLFKATIVPFHTWAPDVYEGATTPLTAFMAVGTKIGTYAAFIRIFLEAIPQINTVWNESLAILFFPTLIVANLAAILQTNLRRFFAYSGVTHSGYLLIALVANQKESTPAILFYLLVYAIATFGAFAVLNVLDKEKRGLTVDDLKGLFFKSPFMSAILTLSLLTLAGIPPTVGFFAKFYVFKVGFDAGYYAMVIFGLFMTIFSAYYYLRLITKMMADEAKPAFHLTLENNQASIFVGALALVGIVILSIFPNGLFDLIG